MADENNPPKRRRTTIPPERFMRRVLEGVGEAVDRKLGRIKTEPSTEQIVERMNLLINQRVRDEKGKGRIAPHHLKMKVAWGTHSEMPPELVKQLETEILAAAIDHINDNRYRTLAPLEIETAVDIFSDGISVDPTFGEFEAELQKQDLERKLGPVAKAPPRLEGRSAVHLSARITMPESSREVALTLVPGGARLNVGRASDNQLRLDHPSISKIHAALKMNDDGTLLVADTGSTNGTHINGVRMTYGEARPIADDDVVAFGEVEVRFRRLEQF